MFIKNTKRFISVFSCVLILLSTSSYAAKDQKKEKSRFEKIELFNKVLHLIESQYYRNVDIEKLIQGAINGMMETLDPHSAFLGKKVFSKMQEETKGEFGGLGIEVRQKDGVIVITGIIDDTPAFKVGIKPGDRIVEINHESIVGITLDEAVEKMRGKAGTPINVGISREGVDEIKRFKVKRKIIQVEPVKSFLVEKNYIFVRLVQFQKRSASSIAKAIKKLKKEARKHGGMKGIILDLRSNPGGLLDEAVNVSSLFLRDGVVVSTEGRDPKHKEIRYVRKTGYKELDIPVVVLINGSSASASEIVAGALQDHKRAVIMGVQSFGKGSVQTVSQIDSEKGVKLTIAQYMTPKGRKIQALGVKPDIELKVAEGKWLKGHLVETNYVREEDLRGHLTATIETAEEKKRRIEKKRLAREMRIKKIEKMKKEKKTKKEEKISFKSRGEYTPHDDYQVNQAVKYIKAFRVFNSIQK